MQTNDGRTVARSEENLACSLMRAVVSGARERLCTANVMKAAGAVSEVVDAGAGRRVCDADDALVPAS